MPSSPRWMREKREPPSDGSSGQPLPDELKGLRRLPGKPDEVAGAWKSGKTLGTGQDIVDNALGNASLPACRSVGPGPRRERPLMAQSGS
jgi:hypothetical protein